MALPARFWLMRSTSGLVVVLELLRFELTRLLVHDVLRQISMSLVTLTSLDLVEILLRIADLIRVAQQRADETLVHRLERDDVLAVSTTRPIPTLSISRMVSRITAKAS